MGILYLLTIGIIVSMVSRVMRTTIGNRVYRFCSQQMVSELMVFAQNSNALDEEEDVKSMEFDGGIKIKRQQEISNLFQGKDR